MRAGWGRPQLGQILSIQPLFILGLARSSVLSHRGLLIQIIQEEYLNISPSGYFKIEPSNDDF